MDKSKINNLLKALADLDEEITKSIQGPLLHAPDKDWQAVIPSLQEACEAMLSGLREAEKATLELRGKVTRTRHIADQIYDLHKETQEQIAPRTLGQSIGAVVEDYLVQGVDVILVDSVHSQLVDNRIVLGVRNPAAVIASILARDERLERVDKGKFRRKIPKDLEEQTV